MTLPNRSLVIYKLSCFSLLFLPILRLIFKRIYFCETSSFFSRRLDLVGSLERLGLRWMKREYSECSEYEKGYSFARDFAQRIFERIAASPTARELSAAFSVPERLGEQMAVVWKKNIFDHVEPFAHQYAAAEFLLRKDGVGQVAVLSLDSISSILKDGLDGNVGLIVLPGLGVLGALFEAARKLVPPGRLLGTTGTGGRPPRPEDGPEPRTVPVNPGGFEIAFFPHQGIFFGKLFLKDHYYDPEEGSPLSRPKMLHVSLDEKDAPYMRETYRYYQENGIPHIDLSDLDHGRKKLLMEYAGFLFRLGRRGLADLLAFGPNFHLLAGKLFYRMRRYSLAVSGLKKLRLALVGYDYLFPCELSLALMSRGVKVCAAQERLIQAFYPQTYMIFDTYFVAGRIVQERGLKNSVVKRCIPVGLARVDNLFECERLRTPDEKYDGIKKTKKLILALDYHVPESDYEDILRTVAKVAQIRRFYADLMSLAREFPGVHIVIKGKIAEGYSSPAIADLVDQMGRMANIEIERDLARYNPYFLSEKADLTIACHTSLADELMAAGRKVLFYEASDYMEMNFDYDRLAVVAKDIHGLRSRIQDFLKGAFLEDDRDKKLRSLYSDCFHGGVQNSIRTELKRLLRD